MVSRYYFVLWMCFIPLIYAGKKIFNSKGGNKTYAVEHVKNKTQEQTITSVLKSSLLHIPEDADLAITDLVPKYGYPLEVHKVLTADGYILTIHRIPNKRGQPVLVFHGLLSSSEDWIITGPKHALGYTLADAGYDVWLTNARGNKYSSHHTNYTTDEYRYWNFSFHEIGLYDLPATIDYILGMRNLSSLYYIGHSQGCAVFFVLCSLRPEYNSKVKVMYALAPAAFVGHMTSPGASALLSQVLILDYFQSYLSIGELPLFKNTGLQAQGMQMLCNERIPTQALCVYLLEVASGYDRDEMNDTTLPVVLAHFPSGSSMKQVLHYGQLYKSGYFRRYDYGRRENYERYERATPPSYNLSRVTAPVYVMYASEDSLTTPVDVEKLYKRLPNVAKVYLVPKPKFDHVDFMWANSAKAVVYDVILMSMKSNSYILTIHRIPNKEGPPVLLAHGLMSSSDDWIITRPKHALGYELADAGYDVWLTNARGNKHSRYINDTTDESRYWNFSIHEIGLYDLPATIDYILEMSLYYIGISQGCTVYFILMTLRPEYNSKVRIMYALAPAVFITIANPLFRIVAYQTNLLEYLKNLLFVGDTPLLKLLDFSVQGAQLVCNERLTTEALCVDIAHLASSLCNREEINDTMVPVLLGHFPAGSSTKQLFHMGQLYNSGYFQWYDYGSEENYKRYNRTTPPLYNLSKATAPVYIMHSKGDALIAPADVEKLHKHLPNVVKVYLVPKPKFNHPDFGVGNSAKTLVYDVILKSMKSYL